MVFYRKYRPQKIEDLDSLEVRNKLRSVLKSSSISHAFLFTGPKGLGKTSTARIVAKSLNCERLASSKSASSSKNEKLNPKRYTLNAGIEPCNKCDQCVSITNGTNMDVLEIDGASNRGIDEIRDLREKIRLSPLSARKKVYIIDEVHMLTTEAFNALLKTLEEPPSHVVFILCTTEPHKVPATILSRCLHIQFRKATQDELVRSFERILKEEKIKGDLEALNLIASLSDGSFRDGVKILEEMVLAARDKNITKELIEQKYQISGIQYQVSQMIKNLENKDTKSSLETVDKLVNDGVSMAHFIEILIQTLHNNLLFKAGVQNSPLRQGFAGQAEFRTENSKMEIGEIKNLIDLLSKAHGELRYAVLPQIPLELAVVEWGIAAAGPVANIPPASAPSSILKNDEVRAAGNLSSHATPRVEKSGPKVTQQNMTGYSENDALWTALIDKVKAYNHSVAGVLRGCHIKSYDGKSLIIETNFKFHKDKLSERKTQDVLEKAIQEITKKKIDLTILLREVKK